ncbi:hypothetical protein [Sphingosinicella soli]|uniref:Glutamine amidotransferase domain-containing protein n=1 Tax=Sphingosinicella soli TaxID=333708 RepID=A0A7W7F5Z6_9SPHN|nr:hypothetical protein [Sphingosinicella soli]MBB4631159.1 hypothetical protein [Sphingosinicella soli]
MTQHAISFAPLLPWWGVIVIGVLFAAGLALVLWRAPRLFWPRALIAAVLLLLLANPVRFQERRAVKPDVAVAVIDRSASMGIGNRTREADAALAALRRASPGVEWRVVPVPQAPGEPTRLAAAIERAASDAPAGRLAGVVVVSDGISADAPDPRLLPADVPLHHLIAGDPDTPDRRLIVERVPSYSVVGQPAEVIIRIDDGNAPPGTATLTESIAGGRTTERTVRTGEPVRLSVPVTRRGTIEMALSVAPLTGGEATLVNNRALVRLNGVTDRLRVLLVSGVPYPGGRVWRDILKSDSNIDLVHFTILRLPTSFDTTPPDEMSLIPFPVEELFEQHLGDFDLIIFDRFSLSELLSPVYFQDLGERVKAGGGLLVVTGEEFAGEGGLAATELAPVLPARTAGPGIEAPFRPVLTPTGRRHPVTSELPKIWGTDAWGRWASQSDMTPTGEVLMSGAQDKPLVILDRVGRGRVGLIASTNVWWWSRGVDGAGPHAELLRRIAHWLMQEPDLDENRLDVSAAGRRIDITARGIAPPEAAILTDPSDRDRGIPLAPRGEGVTGAAVTVGADGLYRVAAGERIRYVLAGDSAEFAEVRPREAPLSGPVKASGGGSYLLQDGQPGVRRITPGDAAAGPGWLGLVENRAGAIVAVDEKPLLMPLPALLLAAGLFVLAWWRERR